MQVNKVNIYYISYIYCKQRHPKTTTKMTRRFLDY